MILFFLIETNEIYICIYSLTLCYGLNVCAPLVHMLNPTHNVMVSGAGESLGGNEVTRVGHS